jgi:hypothetical protein
MYPGICLEGMRKNALASVKITDFWADISNWDVPDTKHA